MAHGIERFFKRLPRGSLAPAEVASPARGASADDTPAETVDDQEAKVTGNSHGEGLLRWFTPKRKITGEDVDEPMGAEHEATQASSFPGPTQVWGPSQPSQEPDVSSPRRTSQMQTDPGKADPENEVEPDAHPAGSSECKTDKRRPRQTFDWDRFHRRKAQRSRSPESSFPGPTQVWGSHESLSQLEEASQTGDQEKLKGEQDEKLKEEQDEKLSPTLSFHPLIRRTEPEPSLSPTLSFHAIHT
mmetsp:Transcript_53944/g.96579  ORF Transcript_53944/g.96579 Transcript_53944/m.96579 type:complete len:244 (+) Transcript_53944:20-751(+)